LPYSSSNDSGMLPSVGKNVSPWYSGWYGPVAGLWP